MGFVQQGWVGQSRGKMPLPRLPIETWERHLAAIALSIAPGRRSHNDSVYTREPAGGRTPVGDQAPEKSTLENTSDGANVDEYGYGSLPTTASRANKSLRLPVTFISPTGRPILPFSIM